MWLALVKLSRRTDTYNIHPKALFCQPLFTSLQTLPTSYSSMQETFPYNKHHLHEPGEL